LALIALFQRLGKEGQKTSKESDPFVSVKTEKRPPVPTLYPISNENCLGLPKIQDQNRLTTSNSVPTELNKKEACLLLDIDDDWDQEAEKRAAQSSNSQDFACRSKGSNGTHQNNASVLDLIDNDLVRGPQLLYKISRVWFEVMISMRALFKRVFDILNVENDRKSALEALNSPQGILFCKNLCLCYPIAHNINFKVDELRKKNLLETLTNFDKKHILQITDLMLSINEYWAVLINLFHESGQTNFIELIMDSLNRTNETVTSKNKDELFDELDCSNSTDLCAICHTKFYLINIGDAIEKKELSPEDLELAFDQEVLTMDGCYYYHARCANYWLNNVDARSGKLPFCEHEPQGDILRPTNLQAS